MEVMTQLEGAYALLIKSSHYPGELVACKRGSPLILGIKETPVHNLKRTSSSLISDVRDIRKRPAGEAFEAFVASDASAVVEHTKRSVTLSSKTLAEMTVYLPVSDTNNLFMPHMSSNMCDACSSALHLLRQGAVLYSHSPWLKFVCSPKCDSCSG